MLVAQGYKSHLVPEHLLIEIADKENLSFPLSPPIVLDTDNQRHLKAIAIINQGGICPKCLNELSDAELHHALISRKDALGTELKIHHSCNVLVLHHDCHLRISRQESYQFLCRIFGKKKVVEWYNSIQFNGKMRHLSFYEEL